MHINIGFVGTRFAGLDGVSLEAGKWDAVLRRMKHRTYWFAGEVDRPPGLSMVVKEAHFRHELNQTIQGELFGKRTRTREITNQIHSLKELLKDRLYDFLRTFDIDVLIAENCLSIPMHIPLGIALTEVIAETGIPTIAHHHDFMWERDRFLVNAISDYMEMAFPPDLPSLRHAVINTIAQKELAARKGVPSHLIPNVLDFQQDPYAQYDQDKLRFFRSDFGFGEEDIIFLQPTRIVARKGIEHALELVGRLKNPKTKLVITHSSGDEGVEYLEWIIKTAEVKEIPVRLINNRLHTDELPALNGERVYTLWDIYPHANFITYPSSFEGFGNAFLEGIYYKKPILVNRYPIFVSDIEPKGFDVVTMDGYLTDGVVERVRWLLETPEALREIVEKNYELAKKHFSYDLLRRRLAGIFTSFYGMINTN